MSKRSAPQMKGALSDGFYSFISYSTRDDEIKRLKPLLDGYISRIREEINYIPVFIDRFWTDGGPGLAVSLEDALNRSDFTTAFLSPGYASSPWCAFEWGYARCLSHHASMGRSRHAILPICWKRVSHNAEGALVFHQDTIDVSAEIEASRYADAIEISVKGSLRFIRSLYDGGDLAGQK